MRKIFIIAEVGNLHEGSVRLAKCFINEVAKCGADAVKFQTHIFEAESLPSAPAPSYFSCESRKSYLERTSFNKEEWKELKSYAEECGIEFISSVFSIKAVELMEEVGMKRYKIPSGEVTNLLLLKKVAQTHKPVFLSTGMSNWQDIDTAIDVLINEGCKDITVLQCTSIYPCPPEKVGLNVLEELKHRYNLKIGFSDHTLGIVASIGAVVLGAQVIEKHFTLSRAMYGSDAKHSLQPEEFTLLVKEIREMEKILSSPVDKDIIVRELEEMKKIFEKSVVSKKFIPKGAVITLDMIDFKKPGDGIKANQYHQVIGKKAGIDIPAGMQIRKEMLE